ncbi:MAG: hypothetical protein C4B59_00225 [Candidatus Methanogaster sp.]|uniref:Uncharacterized protein n=1 Tax=Candidatus Methanogaster sp. TaxID=3386292 RepID=A0AC61L6V6_9EURY|nr:MAG: hypothetical protein C4B59_00225 [ANME-2 cluster archaeon]
MAKDSNKEDINFKRYTHEFISKREAHVLSEEIGYPIKFSSLAQKRELHSREDMEFNIAFNYRGAFAIDLRPV